MIKTSPVSIFIMERTAAGFVMTSAIDTYESLDFEQSFFNIGSFSFTMLADSPQAKYVQPDSFIIVGDSFGSTSYHVGIIQDVDRSNQEDSKKVLTAKGLEAKCILSYRMVDPGTVNARYTSTGTFEAAVKAMVDSQCGATATDANRVFPGFTVAASAGRGPTYTFNERWSNLSDAVQKGCIAAEVGYRVYWNGSGLVFDTIHGIDRTLGNGVHNPAVFSTDFDTVKESHFQLSKSNYKNYAYAGGQGVGVARVIQPVTSEASTPTGFQRREIFVDARDLSATADLTTRGGQALDEYKYQSYVEAVINPYATFSQSSGVDLGDLVTVQSFGYEQTSRVSGITEQWGEAGYDCALAMDRQLPTVQTIANAEAYKANRSAIYAEGSAQNYSGALTGILSSSNANQYFDLFSAFYIRIGDIVHIKASFRWRSKAGKGTQGGQVQITPPAFLAIGTGTSTTLSPGWVWRNGGSITSDNEWMKFDSANARIISDGTLDSIEAGLIYGFDIMYTMSAT
jgi:hypothetical protein